MQPFFRGIDSRRSLPSIGPSLIYSDYQKCVPFDPSNNRLILLIIFEQIPCVESLLDEKGGTGPMPFDRDRENVKRSSVGGIGSQIWVVHITGPSLPGAEFPAERPGCRLENLLLWPHAPHFL